MPFLHSPKTGFTARRFATPGEFLLTWLFFVAALSLVYYGLHRIP